MQDDYRQSNEEKEQKFKKDLERWETEESYMKADDMKFLLKPTDAGAKVLWLKYTKLGRPIPDYVIKRMIAIIERDVKKRPNSRLVPEPLPNTIFPLIHLALSGKKEDLEQFWEILHSSSEKMLSLRSCISEDILKAARETFPIKGTLDDIELFKFAAKLLYPGDVKLGEKPEELARRRYKTFKKIK